MGRNSFIRTGQSFVDQLEARRLFATVSITNFGAVPNDGRDDLSAIKAAINASGNGDTVYFPAGTYNVSDQIYLKGGRNYQGADAGNTTVQGNDTNRHVFHIQQDNTSLQDLTIIGKPIMIDSNNGMVAGLLINDNVIKNTGTGVDNNSITFTTGLRNSTISNNKLDGIGPMGIYGYYWDGLKIANNEFLNGGEGMHVDDHSNNSRNLTIEQNLFSGIRRMGVEYQGGGYNTILQDNWYEKPTMTSNFHDNDATFAFSIVADRSVGTISRRNVIWAPERPDGVGVRIGFETGGDGSQNYDNYVYGINQVLANTDGTGSTSISAHDNHYHQTLDGLVGRGLSQYNNGPNVDKQWLINRGKPGKDRRFTDPSNPNGGVSNTGSTSTPAPSTPTPTPVNVPAASGVTYLSDLNWSSMNNGWGSAEKNKSNGEQGANDGRTLSIAGQTYAKGIGTHAGSEIVYNLNGQYDQFASDVGIDEEVGNNGGAVFQVYLDNAKVYDSGKLTGSMAAKGFTLDVSGKNTLKLVVTDGGDGNGFDHADWANARLTSDGASAPDPAPDAGDGSTWLSDLNWATANNGWGAVEKDRSNGEQGNNDGKALSLRSNTYAKGLGVHADSDIRFNINKQYDTFSSDIGLDNEVNGNGLVVFQVYLDGVLKYDSGNIGGKDAVKQLSIGVAGANELRLVVKGINGNTFDHADWAGAKLS